MYPCRYNSHVAMVNKTQDADTHGLTLETKPLPVARIVAIEPEQVYPYKDNKVAQHHKT